MAAKTGVDDLFDDGTMSFAEHIGELRDHLIRAIWGILAAVLITIIFAHKIVEVLTLPLSGRLEIFHKEKLERRNSQYTEAQLKLPPEQRAKIKFKAEIDAETLAKELGVKPQNGGGPLVLDMKVDAYEINEGLAIPMAEINEPWRIKTLSAQEPFVMYFKAAIGAAIVLSCPWIFYQIYSFIAVGLYAHERRFIRMTLPFSVGLFLGGVAFCYFVMLRVMLGFLIGVNEWMGVEPDIRLNEWVGFCVILMLVFGAAFQLPMLMIALQRVGLVSYEFLSGKRRHAVLGVLIFAAFATPTPDPVSQTVLALPLYGLFEVGLLLMRRFKRHNPFEAEAPFERAFDDELAESIK